MTDQVDQKIQQFFSQYNMIYLDANDILIYAGQNPGAIYKLESGQVNQYDINHRGSKVVINTYKPPAYFPMSWVINKTPNLYYFEAVTAISAYKAPPEDVLKFIIKNPDVLYRLLSRVYLGREDIIRRLAHSMGSNAKTRILFELILEARRFGIVDKNGKITAPMQVNDLAARTGLSRETVSRELAKIKNLGIKTGSKGILLESIESLEEELGDSL